jgi:Na+/proline symporter/PAS domain-containing protein
MLHDWGVIAAALGYIGFLFCVASYGDRIALLKRGRAGALIYPLSLAIYCTSWTFFGSVGFASRTSVEFLAIYVGPILLMVFCTPVLRRVIHLAKSQNITSIADFIAARYGKSQAVAATAAVIAIIGSVPYIALQLKAVASSLETILGDDKTIAGVPVVGDMALIVTLAMAVFAMLFGTRQTNATEHQHGLMLAIATESIVKLVAFITVGAFVTFWMFGPVELFERAMKTPEAMRAINDTPSVGNFFTMVLLSFCAIMLLPRQFHVSVVENSSDAEVSRARWLFPLYLVAINLFVIPIALAGLVTFPFGAVDSDMYVLALPIEAGSTFLSMAVFIGGLSAATAMVIVECVALAIMVSNDLVLPLVLRRSPHSPTVQTDFGNLLLKARRFAIFAIMAMAYFYFRALGNTQLAAIGLLSFAAIAQFAPAFFGGLIWRRATARGAMGGMVVGFVVWAYTLFIPSFLDGNTAGMMLLQHGPFGIEALRPQDLFGADLPPLMHGTLWSLSLNILTYIVLSLMRAPSSIERLQADVFVPNALAPVTPAFRRWRTTVTVQDILGTVTQYLGPARARESFEAFAASHRVDLDPAAPADFELLQHAEHLIASSIGAASSRVVMSLLLRRRTVSAKAALKLLDDSHAALHFNREILQTALNHVRQGIAVFNPELQLICSNRQFGEILGLPPQIVQIGIPLREILEFIGAQSAPSFGDNETLTQMRLIAYTTEGEPYLERLPDRQIVIEVRANRMPDGGLVLTFSDVTPSFEAAEALERANATLEKRVRDRTEEHLEDAVSRRGQPRHPATAQRRAALRHQPGGTAKRRRRRPAGREHRRFAGSDRGDPRRAAGHLAARCRRHEPLDLQFPHRRSDAFAGNRIRADRPRPRRRPRVRAMLAASGIRSAAAAPVAAEPDLQRDQIHPAWPRAGRLPATRQVAADRHLRHRRRHTDPEARRDLQGIPPARTGRADRARARARPVDRQAARPCAQSRHRAGFQPQRRLVLLGDGTGGQGDQPHHRRDQLDAAVEIADVRHADRLHRERRGNPRRHEDAADGLGRHRHRGRRSRSGDRSHRGDRGVGQTAHRPTGRLSSRSRQRRCCDPRNPQPLRAKHSGDPDHRRSQPACAGRRPAGKDRGAQQAGEAGLAARTARAMAHAADDRGRVVQASS